MWYFLVVDDERSICEALAFGLASDDVRVDTAPDGRAALRLGGERNYDVLITDLCLPDMDGFQVVQDMRRYNPKIKCIITTAYCTSENFREATRRGISCFIEKPFDLGSMKRAIRHCLEPGHQGTETFRLYPENRGNGSKLPG